MKIQNTCIQYFNIFFWMIFFQIMIIMIKKKHSMWRNFQEMALYKFYYDHDDNFNLLPILSDTGKTVIIKNRWIISLRINQNTLYKFSFQDNLC